VTAGGVRQTAATAESAELLADALIVSGLFAALRDPVLTEAP